jgi:pimeloyl-ACP methyl ester carboxylesterase
VEGARAFSDYIEDVARAAQALPGRAFWIGHSLGGAALYGAAARLGSSSTARPLGVIGIGAIYTFAQANPFLKLLSSLSLAASRQRWFSRFQVRTQLAGQLIARLYSISDVAGFAFPVSGWWPGSIEPELLEERLQKGFDWTSVQVWLEMSRWATTGEVDFDEQWRRTDLPLLVILGDKDHLAPPGDGRVAFDRSGSSDRSLLLLDDWHHETHWGHLDIVLGRLARRHVWEPIDRWMAERLPAPRR